MKNKSMQIKQVDINFVFPLAALLCASMLASSCGEPKPEASDEVSTSEITDFAGRQLVHLLDEIDEAIEKNPEGRRGPNVSVRSVRDGELFLVSSRDWTSGFLPGQLWYMYELTGDDFWLEEARNRTAPIEREKTNDGTHDMGFKIYCSFGNGYRLSGDSHYRDVIVESSQTLITRYNETVGAIRSWDFNRETWDFPVIVDNMMNLELLFRASEITGDPIYHDIAVQHARTTMEHIFRDDNSSYHVIDFDTTTGEVRNRHTHQGAFHESAWARGQAWGLYGYAMSYRFTQLPEFLEQAKKIAEFMLDHPNLPADMVPYWDYNAENIPSEPRDASAAAITASALYELSTFVAVNSEYYKEAADQILASLYHNYRSDIGDNLGFLLDHSTGNHPGGYEIDTPITYADYYFIEAALRKQELEGS